MMTPSTADSVLGLVSHRRRRRGGTAIGGVAVDKLGDSVGNALAVCAVSGAAGFILLEVAAALTSLSVFLAFFLLGETAAFVTQAPINAVVLWSVPPRYKAARVFHDHRGDTRARGTCPRRRCSARRCRRWRVGAR